MCFHIKFGSSATSVYAQIESNPQIGERWDPAPLGWGVADPKNKPPPHMFCHVKFDSFATKAVCLNRMEPKQLGSAEAPPSCDRGVDDSLEIRSSPTCYAAEFGLYGSNGTSVIQEIRLTNLTIASRLSWSLKVVGSDPDLSTTYYFILTFHSNHGPISYRFRDNRRFQSKIAKFSLHVYFAPPAEGVPLGFGHWSSVSKKLE